MSGLQVKLLPASTDVKDVVENAGHKCHLQLNVSAKKPISFLIQHCCKKWTTPGAGTPLLDESLLRFSPYENASCSLSWGANDHVPVADVHALVGQPAVFMLKYWLAVPAAPSREGLQYVQSQAQMQTQVEHFARDRLATTIPRADSQQVLAAVRRRAVLLVVVVMAMVVVLVVVALHMIVLVVARM
jgi:hypothetical protein